MFNFPPGGGPSLHVDYGLIGTKGLYLGFCDIVALMGQYKVNLFVVLTTLEFAPDDT